MENLIPKHGGFRNLKTFQLARLIYDVTLRFCERYINKKSRTHDQMVQAARSGVQNIAEGSQASGTSKKTELKLTNVARASLEELYCDYEDFLRQRSLPKWNYNDSRRQSLVAIRPQDADEVARWVKHIHEQTNTPIPEVAANAVLTLLNVTNKLLDRQLAAQATAFQTEGGFTERLYRMRTASRQRGNFQPKPISNVDVTLKDRECGGGM